MTRIGAPPVCQYCCNGMARFSVDLTEHEWNLKGTNGENQTANGDVFIDCCGWLPSCLTKQIKTRSARGEMETRAQIDDDGALCNHNQNENLAKVRNHFCNFKS